MPVLLALADLVRTLREAPDETAAHASWVRGYAASPRGAPKFDEDGTRTLLAIARDALDAERARRGSSACVPTTHAEPDAIDAAFVGESDAARAVIQIVPRLARANTSVLLLGESGTGKTLVAGMLHTQSERAHEPFRVINCAAIPEGLIESELFGHTKGAFTGALTTRVGVFESAGGGTIFLDEIGELPLASQAKLLRVLEEGRFERLGSNRALSQRARVITATNRDIAKMVAAGAFRADLYYRISVVRVVIPALRDRGDDVVVLAHRVLRDVAARTGHAFRGFTRDALDALRAYAWPGNVRELRNVVEAAVVLGQHPWVGVDDLPPELRGLDSTSVDDPFVARLPASLAELEERAIRAAMAAANGNQTRASALLGMNRVTLYKKLLAEPRRARTTRARSRLDP